METLGPSFDQLSKGVNVILTVTSQQRNETLKLARHAETLRKENISLQDAVKTQKRTWQESEQERASLAINLKLARAELVAEEQRRRDVDTRRRDAEARCRTLENQVSLIRELVLQDKQRRSMLSEHELQKLDILQPSNEDIGVGDASDAGMSMSIDPSSTDLSQADDLDGSHLRSGRKWRRSDLQRTYNEGGESDEDPMSPPRKKTINSMQRTTTTTGHPSSSSTPKVNVVTHTTVEFSPPSAQHVLSGSKRQAPQPNKRPPSRHVRMASTASAETVRSEDDASPSAPPYDDLFPETAGTEEPALLPLKSSLRRQASSASIQTLVESRPHEFTKKSVMTREICCGCQSNIKFAAAGLKCKDCRIICHEACRDHCPLPCVPSQTPQSKQVIKDGSLESFAPRRPPYVPSLLVHCAKEVEKRGLMEMGIYRLSGKDKSVKDLKAKLLKGSKSGAGLVMTEDINVVSCTLKQFLRDLKEPLVPPHYFRALLDATEVEGKESQESMLQCSLRSLPTVNQHTLAYVILHLLRVAENSSKNKMTVRNLNVVFVPTILGPPDERAANVMADLQSKTTVLDALMSLDPSFWSDILNTAQPMSSDNSSPTPSPQNSPTVQGSPVFSPSHPRQLHQRDLITPVHLKASKSTGSPVTPETKQAPEIGSVLGPITLSAQRSRGSNASQTPRRALRKRQGGFFSNVKGSAV